MSTLRATQISALREVAACTDEAPGYMLFYTRLNDMHTVHLLERLVDLGQAECLRATVATRRYAVTAAGRARLARAQKGPGAE